MKKLIVVFRNFAKAPEKKKEEIQKSSIRVDSSSDEIPTEYLHKKCTDLTLYKCGGCGLNNIEYCTLNVYRSPNRGSAQSIR